MIDLLTADLGIITNGVEESFCGREKSMKEFYIIIPERRF
jgi:hypothetical protein